MKSLVLLLLLLLLLLSITGCFMTTLNSETRPHIGWSEQRVETALGISYDVTAFASGYEVWRYGYDPHTRWVSGGCTGRYVLRCMHVYFQDGRVIDILWP